MHCIKCQQGKRWSNDELLQILDEYEPWLDITPSTTTTATTSDNDSEDYSAVIAHASQAIAAGSVVGWYQGRSEYGPRALGSRSILADPRGTATADYINAAVKKREDFRPFAPSVLLEHASEWFHGIDSNSNSDDSRDSSNDRGSSGSGASPYMSITVPVKDDKRSQVCIRHIHLTAVLTAVYYICL
jgi:carbamoyltransferase